MTDSRASFSDVFFLTGAVACRRNDVDPLRDGRRRTAATRTGGDAKCTMGGKQASPRFLNGKAFRVGRRQADCNSSRFRLTSQHLPPSDPTLHPRFFPRSSSWLVPGGFVVFSILAYFLFWVAPGALIITVGGIVRSAPSAPAHLVRSRISPCRILLLQPAPRPSIPRLSQTLSPLIYHNRSRPLPRTEHPLVQPMCAWTLMVLPRSRRAQRRNLSPLRPPRAGWHASKPGSHHAFDPKSPTRGSS
jgi:hypothetical protein